MEIDIPNSDKQRVVIVGAGFGGIQLAKSLKDSGFQVVLIDKNNYHCFQPLLYQVATASLEAESIVYPIRKIFQKQKNCCFRMGEINEIDAANNRISIGKKELRYDYLVIATGAKTNFRDNEGLIVSSMGMKTINEALDLRSLILQNFETALLISNERKRQGYLNFVIAGGGPTGVELAGAIAELKKSVLPKDYPDIDFTKMNIYIVQSRDRLLPALSEKSSEIVKGYLEKLNVNVVLNTRVLDFFGDYVQTNTEDIIARTLIWTAGVKGAPIKGLNDNSIGPGNRYVVDAFCKLVDYKNIFAIGDVAAAITPEYPQGHPMIAPVAVQQASCLAKNLINMDSHKPLRPFTYIDRGSMATVGKNRAVVEMGKLKMRGAIAWLIWMLVHLLSLVGFKNKFVALFNWSGSYWSNDKSMRSIISPFILAEAKRKRKEQMKNL